MTNYDELKATRDKAIEDKEKEITLREYIEEDILTSL